MRKELVIAVFLAQCLLGTVFLSVTGCGVEAAKEEGPEKTASLFLQACMDEDAEAAYNLLTEESKRDLGDKSELVSGFAEAFSSFAVGNPETSGNRARAPVELEVRAFQRSLSFQVVLSKEGDAWKVSLPETAAEMERAYKDFMREYTSGG